MNNLLILLFSIFPLMRAQDQLFFPNEDTESSEFPNREESAVLANSPVSAFIRPQQGISEYEKYVDKIIANGISKLTLDIDRMLIQNKLAENSSVVFAPVSIAGALALVLLGSNGKTFKEIIDVMGFTTGVSDIESRSQVIHEQFGRMIRKLQSKSGFQIGSEVVFGSAIFVQDNYPIRTLYKQTAQEIYESEILNVDFRTNPVKTQKFMNAWVSDRTKGKIKEILSAPPVSETKVVIVTAMYFKAQWEHPFFEGVTQKRFFYPNGRKTPTDIKVEMMSNGGYFPYFRDLNLGCEILGFPYKGNRSTMYVIMPFDSNQQKVRDLASRLLPTDFERLVDSTRLTAAVVLFPKMHIESTIDLKESLESLGVRSLFNPVESNLALLSPGPGEDLKSSQPVGTVSRNQAEINSLAVESSNNSTNGDEILIFSRTGEKVRCTEALTMNKNLTTCEEVVETKHSNTSSVITYKKIGNKIGRKISPRLGASRVMGLGEDTLDNIRQIINEQNPSNNYRNPGLYADQIIHKVYMDITETGTEAAASTSVSLSRDGGRLTFRVDVPFIFFIWHEETKVITFWGLVTTPSPNFRA